MLYKVNNTGRWNVGGLAVAAKDKVTATMTVREVMTEYPGAETVFAKHGLTGCGGPRGPIEPLGFFAKMHNVDAEALLRELNEYAAISAQPTRRPTPAPAPQADIYKRFVKAAMVVALTVGCTLGAVSLAAMGLAGTAWSTWNAVTEAHGVAQMLGWVGLFIMGVVYHVLPRLKATELRGRALALASFWLILASIVLRMVGQPLAGIAPLSSMVTLSAVAAVVAASLFAGVALATLASNRQMADFYDKYIVASIVWFWIWTAAMLVLTRYQPGGAAGEAMHSTSLYVGLMGFPVMMIFGFTLRTIPAFMGLRAPNKAAFDVIWWALNLSLAAYAAGSVWEGFDGSAAARAMTVSAAAVEYAAILGFVCFLGIFAKPAIEIDAAGAVRGYERFIKAGYGWLLAAASMAFGYVLYQTITGSAVPHSLVSAYRHALTVGFVSMMIMGMASRIIPVFSGRQLYSPALLAASFVLVNVGNVLRVFTQPYADFFGGPAFAVMGISGFFEVAALALFAYNLWRTIDQGEEAAPAPAVDRAPAAAPAATVSVAVPAHNGARFSAQSAVGEIVEAHPETLGIFARHGFVHLQDERIRRTMAKLVTIEMASRMHGVDAEALLAELNEAVGK